MVVRCSVVLTFLLAACSVDRSGLGSAPGDGISDLGQTDDRVSGEDLGGPRIDLGGPGIDLGEPEVDGGAPVDMPPPPVDLGTHDLGGPADAGCGITCPAGLVCTPLGTCDPAPDMGASCSCIDACPGGFVCTDCFGGICVTCGGAGQPCCNSFSPCASGLSCHNLPWEDGNCH